MVSDYIVVQHYMFGLRLQHVICLQEIKHWAKISGCFTRVCSCFITVWLPF